jgi:hypothetical protein
MEHTQHKATCKYYKQPGTNDDIVIDAMTRSVTMKKITACERVTGVLKIFCLLTIQNTMQPLKSLSDM